MFLVCGGLFLLYPEQAEDATFAELSKSFQQEMMPQLNEAEAGLKLKAERSRLGLCQEYKSWPDMDLRMSGCAPSLQCGAGCSGMRQRSAERGVGSHQFSPT